MIMYKTHPTALIGPDVELGQDVIVGPYAVITGHTRIGDGTWVGPHVVIGTPAENRGSPHPAVHVSRTLSDGLVHWDKDRHAVLIGDNCIIREFTAIQASLDSPTSIGNDVYIMDKAHVAHDCTVGNDVTIACMVSLGGHCTIGNGAWIGLGAVLHQRRRVGRMAMVGMGSVVTKDVADYAKVYGNPATHRGTNTIGMRRAGMTDDQIFALTSDEH